MSTEEGETCCIQCPNCSANITLQHTFKTAICTTTVLQTDQPNDNQNGITFPAANPLVQQIPDENLPDQQTSTSHNQINLLHFEPAELVDLCSSDDEIHIKIEPESEVEFNEEIAYQFYNQESEHSTEQDQIDNFDGNESRMTPVGKETPKRKVRQMQKCVECKNTSKYRSKQMCSICYAGKHPKPQKTNTGKHRKCKNCDKRKPVIIKGLCSPCYQKEYRLKRISDVSGYRKCALCKKVTSINCQDMCKPCYTRSYLKARQNDESARKKCKECKEIKLCLSRGLCSACYCRHIRALKLKAPKHKETSLLLKFDPDSNDEL